MNKEEVKDFLKLYNKFENKCDKICKELSRHDEDWKFMSTFYIEDGEVTCEGDEYWRYGGHEHYVKSFDIKLLGYSDKELEDYVDKLVYEKNKKYRKEQEEKLAEEKKRELKELARLKEKYKNETL